MEIHKGQGPKLPLILFNQKKPHMSTCTKTSYKFVDVPKRKLCTRHHVVSVPNTNVIGVMLCLQFGASIN
jgi:hypothetical protein